MSEKGACWRCAYFERDDEDEHTEDGFCHRYPPVPVSFCDGEEIATTTPGVYALGWCGEFKEEEE